MWPNMQLVKIYNNALIYFKNKVKEYFGEHVTWLGRQGYAFKYKNDGPWIDGPLLKAGKNSKFYGKSYKKILGLQNNVPIVNTISIIPYVVFIGNYVKWDLHGGAIIDEWRDPYVKRDPNIIGKDKELADRYEKVLQIIKGNEELRKTGRKRKYEIKAKNDFEDFVKRLYREKLKNRKKKYNDINNKNVKDKLWNNVTTTAWRYKKKYNEFPNDVSVESVWREEVI